MSKYLGIEVTVVTYNDHKHTGNIYAIDDEKNLVVLTSGHDHARNFVFLNKTYVKDIVIVNKEQRILDLDIPNVNVSSVVERAEQTMQLRPGRSENSLVGKEALSLFTELSKTYRCKWTDQSIFICDLKVTIDPPYEEENVTGTDPAATRIREVLARTRRKLNFP